MTWRRGLIIAGSVVAVLVLVPALALGVFLLLGQAQYRALAETAAAWATDAPVAIEGPFELTFGRIIQLSAAEVVLGREETTQATGLSGRLGHVEVQIELPSLLRGRLLAPKLALARADLLLVTEPAAEAGSLTAEREPEKLDLPPLLPILADVELDNVRLRLVQPAGGGTDELMIRQLRLAEATADGRLSLAGSLRFNQIAGHIEGTLGSLAEAMAPTQPYPVSVTWQRSGLELGIVGTVARPARGQGLDLKVTVEAEDVARVGEIPGYVLPELGPLTGSARVTGNVNAPALDDVSVVVKGPTGPRLTLTGRIDALHRLAGFDLAVSAALSSRELLRGLAEQAGFPTFADDVSEVSLAGHLRGGVPQLALEQLVVSMADGDKRTLEVTGRIGDLLGPTQVDLDVSAQSVEPSGLLRLLPEIGVRLTPTLVRVRGRLADKDGAIRFDIAGAKAVDNSGLDVDASGYVDLRGGWAHPHVGQIDIRCTATAPDSRGLARLLGWELPEIGPLRGRFAFVGQGDDPDLADLDAGTRGSGPVGLRVTGRRLSHLFDSANLIKLEDVRIAVRADRMAPLLAQLGLRTSPQGGLFNIAAYPVPDPGHFDGQARLVLRQSADGDDVLALEDVRVAVGSEASWQAEATGRVGTITLRGPTQIREIDGVGKLTVTDGQAFTAALGLPASQPVRLEASAAINGSLTALRLSNIASTARFDSGFSVRAKGRLEALLPQEPPHYRGLDLSISATAPSTAALSAVLSQQLPVLGAMRGYGRLSDADGRLSLKGLDIHFGPKDAESLSISGQLGDLQALQQISIQAAFAGDLRTLTAPFLDDPLDVALPVHGAMTLSDLDGSLGIEVLHVHSHDNRHMELRTSGKVDDIRGIGGIDLQISLHVPDLSVLDADFELGPITLPERTLRIEGEATGSRGQAGLDGKIDAGGTTLKTRLDLMRVGDRVKLSGKISSDRVDLGDFGWPLDEAPVPATPAADLPVPSGLDPQSTAPPSSRAKTVEGRRDWVLAPAPLPLDELMVMDMDLSLRLGEIHGKELMAQHVSTDIRLDRGQLSLVNAVTGATGGQYDSQLEIDAAARPPALALRASFDEVDAEKVMYLLGDEDLLEGPLRGDVDLKASGHSPRELATTMAGRFELELGRGRLNAGDLRLLSPGLFWLVALAERRRFTDLRCGLVRFKVDEGVAHSKSLLLMTQTQSVAGAGQIDLSRETLDFAVASSGRQLLPELSKPFRIHGDWRHPSVSVGAVGLLADTALNLSDTAISLGAKLITTPLRAAGSLTNMLLGRERKTTKPAEEDDISPCIKATAASG